MYYPQAPKEPSGCAQTIVITRVILSILAVPIAMIFCMVIFVLLTFIALSIHPLLALLTLATGGAIIFAAARWESRRIDRDNPPPPGA